MLEPIRFHIAHVTRLPVHTDGSRNRLAGSLALYSCGHSLYEVFQ